MSLTTRIEQDYIAAYKAKDALRLGVLRLLKTAAKNLQVELMRPVTDEELASVVQKQAKQRQDSIEQFTAANRPDLAEKEAAELSILKNYLPEPLSEEELAAAIDAAIAALGVTNMSGMGKVIQSVMDKANMAHKDAKLLGKSTTVWYNEKLLDTIQKNYEKNLVCRQEKAALSM